MVVDLSEHVEHPPAMHVNVGAVTLINTLTSQMHLLYYQITVIQLALQSSDPPSLKLGDSSNKLERTDVLKSSSSL